MIHCATLSQQCKALALFLVCEHLLLRVERVAHTVLRYTNTRCVSSKGVRVASREADAQTLRALRAVCRM